MIKQRNLVRRATKIDRYILSTFPVLWLPMTEGHHSDGASFLSSDGYGHLCTVTGALWTPQGRTFGDPTADDYITIPDSASLNTLTNFSVSAWVSRAADGVFGAVLGKKDYELYCAISNENVVRFGVGDPNYGETAVTGAPTITGTAFHHIVWVYSGTTKYIYLDGELSASMVAAGNASNAYDVIIGAAGRDIGQFHFLIGTIGEVLIVSRALSAAEIQNIYLTTKWRYR